MQKEYIVDEDFYYYVNNLDQATLIGPRSDNNNISISIPTQINGFQITGIESYAFRYNSTIQEIFIPVSITWIGKYAFANIDNLTIVTFDPSIDLEIIPEGLFWGSKSIINIEIPGSVLEIKNYAFRYLDKLSSVTFSESSSLLTIGNYSFANNPELITFLSSKQYPNYRRLCIFLVLHNSNIFYKLTIVILSKLEFMHSMALLS